MEEKNTAISTAASDSAEMNENSQTSLKSKKTSEKRAVSPFGKEILKVRFAVYAKNARPTMADYMWAIAAMRVRNKLIEQKGLTVDEVFDETKYFDTIKNVQAKMHRSTMQRAMNTLVELKKMKKVGSSFLPVLAKRQELALKYLENNINFEKPHVCLMTENTIAISLTTRPTTKDLKAFEAYVGEDRCFTVTNARNVVFVILDLNETNCLDQEVEVERVKLRSDKSIEDPQKRKQDLEKRRRAEQKKEKILLEKNKKQMLMKIIQDLNTLASSKYEYEEEPPKMYLTKADKEAAKARAQKAKRVKRSV